MEVNDCCKAVAKTIVDKMKSSNSVMVSVMRNTDGKREIRLYTPRGIACGSKSVTIAEFDDMMQSGITSLVEIDIDKLVRSQ